MWKITRPQPLTSKDGDNNHKKKEKKRSTGEAGQQTRRVGPIGPVAIGGTGRIQFQFTSDKLERGERKGHSLSGAKERTIKSIHGEPL